jgi:hypothetical protein
MESAASRVRATSCRLDGDARLPATVRDGDPVRVELVDA